MFLFYCSFHIYNSLRWPSDPIDSLWQTDTLYDVQPCVHHPDHITRTMASKLAIGGLESATSSLN
jgi:hypothetical protein